MVDMARRLPHSNHKYSKQDSHSHLLVCVTDKNLALKRSTAADITLGLLIGFSGVIFLDFENGK